MRKRIIMSFLFLFLVRTCSVQAAGSRLIDNFNDGKVTWSTWTSPDGKNPTLSITPDAAEGNGSLLVEFSKSGFTTLVCRLGVTPPANCDAVSFWIKRVSGNPGCDLQLEENPKRCTEGIDCFRAPMPVPTNDQWTRVVVPFKEFRYAYSMHGKGNQKFEKHKLWAFAIAAYQKPPFAFKIDCVEFVRLADVAANQSSSTSSKNIFTTNTSFEIGTGSWRTDGTIDSTTAAVGTNSLKCISASKVCPTGRIKPDQPYTLSFYAKSKNPGTIAISMWMNYSRMVNTRLPVPTTWTRLSVPVPPTSHPIEAVFTFGTTNPGEPVWIDGVQLEAGTTPTNYEDADPVAVHAVTGAKSEIIVMDEKRPLTLDLTLYNSRLPVEALPLSLYYTISEATLGTIGGSTLSIKLEKGKSYNTKLTVLPKMQPGYYTVRFSLRDKNGTLLKEIVSPITVVHQPNKIALDDSFFGMHTDGLWAIGAEPLHAIGVNWIRHGGALWGATEPQKGNFQMPPGLNVKKDGFGALVTMLTVPPPAWAMGKDGFPASPDLIKGYIDKVLETYKDQITYFDFHNEPDLTLPQIPGREKSFAELMNTAYPSFKATGKKLVFDVSGEATGFAAEVIKHAPQAFDVFAPHPYSNPRYLGPDGMGLGPELGGMKEQLEKFLAIHRAQCPDREFWIGELGWALDAAAPIDSPWAVRHAAFLARSHLVAKSFQEVKRYICFRDIGCIEGGHYEYGIWRHDDGVKPLPATAAYATIAKLLDGAKPLPIISDYDVKIYLFVKGNDIIMAVWDSVDDDSVEPLQLEIPVEEAEVWTMTGAPAPRKPGKDKVALMTINANPSYLILKEKTLERLKTRILSTITNRRPVSLAIALPNLNTLSFQVKNKAATPYAATLDAFVGENKVIDQQPIDIPIGGNIPVTIDLKTPLPITGETIRFNLIPKNNDSVIRLQKQLPPIRVCQKNSEKLSEFLHSTLHEDSGDLIVLDKRNQVLPADPTIGWNGPDNLSCRTRITWNNQYLYILAEVTDNIHFQPNSDVNIWRGDAVQIAIDTLNDAQTAQNYDNNDYEYGFALCPDNKVVTWRWQAAAGMPTGRIMNGLSKIERNGTKTIYHIVIPWRDLTPLKPKPGSVFGLNFIVADNDGFGRNFWIGMTPGIAESKQPAFYKKFVLKE